MVKFWSYMVYIPYMSKFWWFWQVFDKIRVGVLDCWFGVLGFWGLGFWGFGSNCVKNYKPQKIVEISIFGVLSFWSFLGSGGLSFGDWGFGVFGFWGLGFGKFIEKCQFWSILSKSPILVNFWSFWTPQKSQFWTPNRLPKSDILSKKCQTKVLGFYRFWRFWSKKQGTKFIADMSIGRSFVDVQPKKERGVLLDVGHPHPKNDN